MPPVGKGSGLLLCAVAEWVLVGWLMAVLFPLPAAGGLGYVVKPRLGTDLLPAMRAALAGLQFVSPWRELLGFVPPLPALNVVGTGINAPGADERQGQTTRNQIQE
jgi:hypothetical protein